MGSTDNSEANFQANSVTLFHQYAQRVRQHYARARLIRILNVLFLFNVITTIKLSKLYHGLLHGARWKYQINFFFLFSVLVKNYKEK